MAPIIWMAVALGLYAVGIRLWTGARNERRAQMRKTLEALGRLGIHLQFDEGTSLLTGTAYGRQVVCRNANRNPEGGAAWRLEVSMSVPLGMLVMHVRPVDVISRVLAPSAVALELDDADFRKAYVVEAAPADVARRLLDAETRAFFLQLESARLSTVPDGLHLEAPGRVDEPGGVEALLRGLARIAERIGPTTSAALERPEDAPQREAGGYRTPAKPAELAAQLESYRRERDTLEVGLASQRRRGAVLGGVVIVVLVAGLCLLVATCSRR